MTYREHQHQAYLDTAAAAGFLAGAWRAEASWDNSIRRDNIHARERLVSALAALDAAIAEMSSAIEPQTLDVLLADEVAL